MEAAFPTVLPFSLGGAPARAKLVILGPGSPRLSDRFRSLNLEHVSAADLLRQEISRHTPVGRQAAQALVRGLAPPDEPMLAVVRRWFWTRKPDAGFVLTDFPATLLQAQVLDEWLDARGISLTAVGGDSSLPSHRALLQHYRMVGIDCFDPTALLAA